ncbi:L-type lectin-domain containing receptor kinase IV.2 [Linum perenne]
MAMFPILLIITSFFLTSVFSSNDVSFTYNRFPAANLVLDGIAEFTSDNLLRLTNDTLQQEGHAFYPDPVTFKNAVNGTVSSFSTSFVVAIVPQYSNLGGHGIAFVISPNRGLPDSLPSQYLGLFNKSNIGNFTNHVFAVELDTIYSSEFGDIDNNHVGIDINGLDSRTAAPVKRQRKFAEVLEDWEVDYGPHRFKFKDLYVATKGFRAKEELGRGGFGIVFKGVLPKTKNEIAVKRVSHDSRQGMREFVAEIVSIGKLRHRNLVSLLGYCRRKGELLLVYDFMPNSSLDKYLYDQPRLVLKWCLRFKVIKGVASGLFYLHEEWEQVVIHRDVKASNVMVDGEWNGRLGDFGLARLYDHGSDPRTTHVAGTPGYLAPEHARTGKATTSSDAYAFGAFLLEVACGRRPIDPEKPAGQVILVDWVFSCWVRGDILEAMDTNLGEEFVAEEVELVLKLGLLCSHSDPEARPSMRQVHQMLGGELPLPDMSSMGLSISSIGLNFARRERLMELALSSPSSSESFNHLSSAEESLVCGGR